MEPSGRGQVLAQLREQVERGPGKLDFLVHSVGFAPKTALENRLIDTTLEDFQIAMNASLKRKLHAMKWANRAVEQLKQGKRVQVRPRGDSMSGRIEDGQLVTLQPVLPGELNVQDIVLVRVPGKRRELVVLHQILELVTGGTGVLGSALTRELCAHGFEVITVFRSNPERAARLGEETGCTLWQGDMSDEAQVEEVFAAQAFDGVVHLAGWNQNALLGRTSPALWNEVVRSHLESSFLMARMALRCLPRGGQLLLVSSRVGLVGNAGQSAYASAKAGVFGLMRSAAMEGRERGICVNAICPGYTGASSGTLSKRHVELRQSEDLLLENDAASSFAAFTGWFLGSNSHQSGQILRPDCRI